jgi:molybdenum cofactor cytidylyltransferase
MTNQKFIWVLLAAGGSTRLGRAKQLLSLGQTTLIHHQTSTLLATGLPVCVVGGAEELSPHLPHHKQLTLIHNTKWQNGLATSIQLAQSHYPEHHLGWVLVDQYAITTKRAREFYDYWQQQPCLALASQYDTEPTAWGVPVITHNKLMATADIATFGLKPWLQANQQAISLEFFSWPEAKLDLDTPEQWQKLKCQSTWHEITSV